MKYIIATCFIAGLVLAGSDGDWFPWANFIGLVGLGGFVILANKTEGEGK